MEQKQANLIAQRFVEFLETGGAPTGLFTDDTFCDFTMPRWRLQAQGMRDVRGESIADLSVYCTGDWDTAREEEHARAVKLLRR
jgi:hypothetical protein